MHNWEEFALLLVSPSLCLWPGAWASHGNGRGQAQVEMPLHFSKAQAKMAQWVTSHCLKKVTQLG